MFTCTWKVIIPVACMFTFLSIQMCFLQMHVLGKVYTHRHSSLNRTLPQQNIYSPHSPSCHWSQSTKRSSCSNDDDGGGGSGDGDDDRNCGTFISHLTKINKWGQFFITEKMALSIKFLTDNNAVPFFFFHRENAFDSAMWWEIEKTLLLCSLEKCCYSILPEKASRVCFSSWQQQ